MADCLLLGSISVAWRLAESAERKRKKDREKEGRRDREIDE